MALEWLRNSVSEVSARLGAEVSKICNRDFLEAVVAGCALVAHADGGVKPQEKQKMMKLLQSTRILSAFDAREVIEAFDEYADRFQAGHSEGEKYALATIDTLRCNVDEARLMVRVCCAIGAAHDDFDERERACVREICRTLGLDPAEFELD